MIINCDLNGWSCSSMAKILRWRWYIYSHILHETFTIHWKYLWESPALFSIFSLHCQSILSIVTTMYTMSVIRYFISSKYSNTLGTIKTTIWYRCQPSSMHAYGQWGLGPCFNIKMVSRLSYLYHEDPLLLRRDPYIALLAITYIMLSKGCSNERRYICNIVFNWLRYNIV